MSEAIRTVQPGAADKRGLDEIVAHDVPAEGRTAGKVGQACGLSEGLSADDGVVAPVVPLRAASTRRARC